MSFDLNGRKTHKVIRNLSFNSLLVIGEFFYYAALLPLLPPSFIETIVENLLIGVMALKNKDYIFD
jgi:hypothetical protein